MLIKMLSQKGFYLLFLLVFSCSLNQPVENSIESGKNKQIGSSIQTTAVTSGNYCKIINKNSGKVLDVQDASTAGGTSVVQRTDNGGASQQWQFVDLGTGYYKIINRNSGLYMDINGSSTTAGATNIQWYDNEGLNQQWQVVDLGTGYYKIINRNSGLLMDINGASQSDGAVNIQWSDNGGINQQWQITALSSLTLPPSGGSGESANTFKGFNWADPNDNFNNGNIEHISGLTAADTYSSAQSLASMVLNAFQSAGANTVRLPINPATVSSDFWGVYKGVIDKATGMGFKVILAYWGPSWNVPIPDMNAWYAMWDKVLTDYNGNGKVYFEIFNEPPDSGWLNTAAAWLSRYTSAGLEKGRVIVDGTAGGYSIPPVASDSRFNGCLLSLHIYAFSHTESSDSAWYNYISGQTGSSPNRVIVTEFGAPMSDGQDYNNGNVSVNNIGYMKGVTQYMHDKGCGSIYWPGLRDGDSYSMYYRNGTASLTLQSTSGLDRVRYGWNNGGNNASPTYYFATFGSDSDQRLYVYTSDNGINFSQYYTGFSGPTGVLRDPALLYLNGKYYIAFTTQSWTTSSTSFAIASSTDLKNWTTIATVDCGIPGTYYTWAPDWYVEGGVIKLIVSIGTGGAMKPYLFTAQNSDLTSWSGPADMNLGINYIDSFVVKSGNTYHCYSKNETTKYIEHFTASSLSGPWTKNHTYWYGYEGVSVIQLPNGTWRMYVDHYSSGDGIYTATSSDLNNWSSLTKCGFGRHGSCIIKTASVSSSSSKSSSSTSSSSSSSPNNSVDLPGKITAANYNAMSGVQTEQASEGGQNVGWIDAGDWMDYTVNVTSAGSYAVEYRVASLYGGGSVALQTGGNTLTTTSLPNTGGWQTYTSVITTVNLSAGRQTLRVLAVAGGWNITTVNLTKTVASSSSSRSVSSSSSTSSAVSSGSSSSSGVVYTAITAPFSIDGTGEFYWQISNIPSYINSWNLDILDINGVSFLNKYGSVSQLPAKQNGFYYIHYKCSVSWGHFEVK